MERISRRSFLKSAGAAAAVIVAPGCERPGRESARKGARYVFFNADDAANASQLVVGA